MFRPLMSVVLAALMALTSVTMAVARVQDRMSTAVELCADGVAQTINVDGQGNPVGPHHVCPDCLMGAAAVLLQGALALMPPQHASRLYFGRVWVGPASIAAPHPSARGPPASI